MFDYDITVLQNPYKLLLVALFQYTFIQVQVTISQPVSLFILGLLSGLALWKHANLLVVNNLIRYIRLLKIFPRQSGIAPQVNIPQLLWATFSSITPFLSCSVFLYILSGMITVHCLSTVHVWEVCPFNLNFH